MSEMASGSATAVRTQSQQKSKTGSGDVRPSASVGMRTRQQANLDTLRSTLKRIRSGSVAKNAKPAAKKRRTSVLEIGLRTEVVEISASEKEALQPVVSEIEIDPSEDEEKEPTLQRALVVARKGQYEIRHDFPIPVLGDTEVMIRSHYVGLNPIDWKSVDYNFCLPDFPWVTGREMSGVVEKVGKHVQGIQPGDKVWTSTYYKDVRAGCFQELVIVPKHTVAKIPKTVPFEYASCLGVPALTACMTLWKWLQVPMPSQDLEMAEAEEEAEPNAEPEEPSDRPEGTDLERDEEKDTEPAAAAAAEDEEWLLIWGGSTATGQFATQVAVHAGLNVITVNSATTKCLSERLGATHVVVRDGKTDEEILAAIRDATAGAHITRAIDLVGAKTAALVLAAVSKERPVHFAPLAFMSSSQVVPDNVTAHTVEMKRFVLDESSKYYADELNALLEADMLVLPDVHLIEGGFDAIPGGLEMLKKGNMKGKKLIIKI